MNDSVKNILLWVVIGLVLLAAFQAYTGNQKAADEITYSEFLEQVDRGGVQSVEMRGPYIEGKLSGGGSFTTYSPESYNYGPLLEDLREKNIPFRAEEIPGPSMLEKLFFAILPILLLVGVWIYFMRSMQGGGAGGGRGAMSFGKSKAKMLGEDQIKVTFNDVAGCDEAKEEVQEIVDFLKDPGKFQKLGGHIPKGVLMAGDPGTGKTLLAKAIAGEAKVPFFTISGSDFVEMFVGVGASRVRDMFAQARKHGPCIVFIDEIDAVGRHRGSGMGGGNDEREQTLNQLLVEMDGFEGHEGVIVIAATNRPDVLDKALLRPGRFDRQVNIGLPDIRGRDQILQVHIKKVPLAPDVKTDVIARTTPGYSGAELANLVNEAALFAARGGKRLVEMDDFDMARDKINMGPERRSMVMDDEERLLTSYHEAGHAIVGMLVPSDPLYKVTIIPRGRALGVTFFLPEKDRLGQSKEWCEATLAKTMGGRAAEILIYGADKVTNGASGDIQQATSIARAMVEQWGMSDALGPVLYAGRQEGLSGETARIVDDEVRRIVDESHTQAATMLKENEDVLHSMAQALMKYETLDADQVAELMERKEPTPPPGWGEDSSTKPPSGGAGVSAEEQPKSNVTPIGGPADQQL